MVSDLDTSPFESTTVAPSVNETVLLFSTAAIFAVCLGEEARSWGNEMTGLNMCDAWVTHLFNCGTLASGRRL
jgi:hypothetical protein